MFSHFFVKDQEEEQEKLVTEIKDTSVVPQTDAYWTNLRSGNNTKNEDNKEQLSNKLDKYKSSLSPEYLMAKIRDLNMTENSAKIETQNITQQPSVYRPSTSLSIIEDTKATLISFKDISAEMINDLQAFGDFEFIKFANLESELAKLKNTLNSLTSKQDAETAKITEMINLHQEIVDRFDQIKNLSDKHKESAYDNVSLANEDVKIELLKLKEERETIPTNTTTERVTLEEQIQVKTLELRELHKDVTSKEKRDQVLHILSILIKIQKITNATQEVKDLTNKLDPEKMAMLLDQISKQGIKGFLYVMASKKKAKIKKDEDTEEADTDEEDKDDKEDEEENELGVK